MYDSAGNLTAIQIPDHGYMTIGQYKWFKPSIKLYPGGVKEEFDYDSFMRLKDSKTIDPGNNILENSGYTYDKSDNIVKITRPDGVKTYLYDDLYRLKKSHSINTPDEEYLYDESGNRSSSSEVPVFEYNANNELISYGNTKFTYDENGNIKTKIENGEKTSFLYNPQGRIKEIWKGEPATGALTAKYKYDPFGRRLFKETKSEKTYFIYSDEGIAGEADETGTLKRIYLFEPDSIWGTAPVMLAQNDKIYFDHNDHRGAPESITSESGAVVWDADYTSFGKALINHGEIKNNLRLPGQYYDEETGLHYNWNRYYDPFVGRYLTADPIGLAGGINLYAYCSGNPINLIDPQGLQGYPLTGPDLLRMIYIAEAIVAVISSPAVGVAAIVAGGGIVVGVLVYEGYQYWMAKKTSAKKEKPCDLDKSGDGTAEGKNGDSESEEKSSPPVDKNLPPDHPDFKPNKKKKGLEKVPLNKNSKGYPDKNGDYWEPVPDGHKGTHDPHWDVQHPDGTHTPKYPLKK